MAEKIVLENGIFVFHNNEHKKVHKKLTKLDENTFEFEYATAIGTYSFKELTEDGRYVYEIFYHDTSEDDGGYYYNVLVLDSPLESVIIPNYSPCYFNKFILTYFVIKNKKAFLEKAKKLNAEVFGKSYRTLSTYRGNAPWASIEDAITIAKKEIANHEVDCDKLNNEIDDFFKNIIDRHKTRR